MPATRSATPECEEQSARRAIYEKLLYRHWTDWWDGKRSHLFVAAADGGTPRDLTPGADYDVPPFNLGAPEAIAFSPDGRELCFTANTDKDEALQHQRRSFYRAGDGREPAEANHHQSGQRLGAGCIRPTGKWIAYRAQMQPGYERDRWRLMLYDRHQRREARQPDREFRSQRRIVRVVAGQQDIYFQTEDKAEMPIYSIAATPGAHAKAGAADGFNADFDLSRDGRTLAFARTSLTMPAEVFAADARWHGFAPDHASE